MVANATVFQKSHKRNKPLARRSLKSWHLQDRWTPSRLFQRQQNTIGDGGSTAL